MSVGRLGAKSLTAPWELAGMPPETPVLLAFSGGMDSSVLLRLLAERATADGFRILPVHINHHIRGTEAERDAAFCRNAAERYGMELLLFEEDVPALAKKHGRSMEEEAREVRYAIFEKVMRERNIPLLATAHHADDQLETVLFRMCRGSGLQGLCGIPPVRSFANGCLTRPLLPYSKAEIREYCEREHVEYVQDSTNADATYTRNLIRLEVVPALERVAPDPQKSVYRLARSLTSDLDYIESSARNFLRENRDGGKVRVGALRSLHPAVRQRVFAAMLPEDIRMEAIHAGALESLVAEENSGASRSLPGGYRACLQSGSLAIVKVPEPSTAPLYHPFGEETFRICDGNLTVCVKKSENLPKNRKIHNLSTDRYIFFNVNSDIMKKMYWRTRKAGDTLLFHGVNRKLRKLYRDAGIPPTMRNEIPLLCDGEGVLWAPYVGLRDGVRNADPEGSLRIEVSVRGWDTPL